MEISKQDFQYWRDHPVTLSFLEEVLVILDAELANLVNTAGLDQLKDNFRRGHIQGLKELADWEPEFVEDTPDVESEGT